MILAEHQREALARAENRLHSLGGVILADAVGLGKSFVAAAAMRNAEARGDAVELIVPASLVPQWRETLDALDLAILLRTHDGIVRDPFVPDVSRARLVVVDEAHAFRNPRTQRYAALARRTIGAGILLVTATPLCNSLDDLEALVALIARDDLLAPCGVPSIDVAFRTRDIEAIDTIVAELVIRRERDVLPPDLQFGALHREVVRYPLFHGGGQVDEIIGSLQFPLVGESAILRRFLWRRLESSEAALLESIRRQLRFYERARDCIRAGRVLPKRDYRKAFGAEEDRDAFQQVLFWDVWAPAVASSQTVASAADLCAEMSRLEQLRAIVSTSTCPKRQLLVDLVRDSDDPILIFTLSVATARDLRDAVAPTRRCGLVTARERDAQNVFNAFRAGRLDAVVATDLAAEGLNLQRAGVVVHYDIPWNPMRLEQRNGRAHRIGQKRDLVCSIYFLPDGDETGIARIVASKNRERRRVLRVPSSPTYVTAHAPTLRPRLARDAAALSLLAALARHRLPASDSLGRRHRAGLERLLAEMAHEYLDEQRLKELMALMEHEP